MKRERNEDFWEGIDHIPKPPRDKYDHEEIQEPTWIEEVDKAISEPPTEEGEVLAHIDEQLRKDSCEASEHKPNPEYEKFDSENIRAKKPYPNDTTGHWPTPIRKTPSIETVFGQNHSKGDNLVEREFEATFSYKYNTGGTRNGTKLIYATTETENQGICVVKEQLFKSYPNLDVHSIIHKED